ncbi:hypothetical protein AB0J52_12885 [Spirillospora sp. NPDC049652]
MSRPHTIACLARTAVPVAVLALAALPAGTAGAESSGRAPVSYRADRQVQDGKSCLDKAVKLGATQDLAGNACGQKTVNDCKEGFHQGYGWPAAMKYQPACTELAPSKGTKSAP